jgi:hypothetical protein
LIERRRTRIVGRHDRPILSSNLIFTTLPLAFLGAFPELSILVPISISLLLLLLLRLLLGSLGPLGPLLLPPFLPLLLLSLLLLLFLLPLPLLLLLAWLGRLLLLLSLVSGAEVSLGGRVELAQLLNGLVEEGVVVLDGDGTAAAVEGDDDGSAAVEGGATYVDSHNQYT